MRTGRDQEDTGESMHLGRHLRKYILGAKKRHLGGNRLRHRGEGRKGTSL